MTLQDKETRYFIDINIKTNTVTKISFGQRKSLVSEKSKKDIHRVFITKGQYNKLQDQISFSKANNKSLK